MTVITAAMRSAFASAMRERLAADGRFEFDSSGMSMHPAIPGGSAIEVAKLPEALAPGDLLVFVPDYAPVLCCHRVIELGPDGSALTRGDNNPGNDGFIASDHQVGVALRARVGGRWYRAPIAEPPSLSRRAWHRALRIAKRWRGQLGIGALFARSIAIS